MSIGKKNYKMTGSDATAEIFITALKSLSKKERYSVLLRIADEKELREDLFGFGIDSKTEK